MKYISNESFDFEYSSSISLQLSDQIVKTESLLFNIISSCHFQEKYSLFGKFYIEVLWKDKNFSIQ